jgi:hypothetical protein
MFDLIGAVYAVANSGKTIADWVPMLPFIALGFCSYIWYHKRRMAKSAAHEARTEVGNVGHEGISAIALG